MPWSDHQRKVLAVVLLYYLLKRRRRERNRRAQRLRRDRRRQILQQEYSSDETSSSSSDEQFEEEEIDDFTDSNDVQRNEEGVEIKQEVDPFDEDSNFNEELEHQTNRNHDVELETDDDSSNIEIKEEVFPELSGNGGIKLEPCDIKEEVEDYSLDMDADPVSDCLEMTANDFQILVELIGPYVKKLNTQFRQAVPVKDRVAAALCYLETGGPFSHISSCLNISRQLICGIVPEVCNALIESLDTNTMMPNCQQDWLSIAKKFETQFKMPNCVGILVGRRIQKTNIGLILLIDAEHNILFSEIIDCPSKDFNFDTSELYKKIISNEINLPPEQPLPARSNPMPYVFLADQGFPLTPNIIRCYSNPEDEHQEKFNKRLSMVNRTFENFLGFISLRFQVWTKQMILKADTTKIVLKSTICLYNFLRRNEESKLINCPEGTFDSEIDANIVNGSWREKNSNSEYLKSSYLPFSDCFVTMENAGDMRDEFVDYLNHQLIL